MLHGLCKKSLSLLSVMVLLECSLLWQSTGTANLPTPQTGIRVATTNEIRNITVIIGLFSHVTNVELHTL